MDGRKAVGEKNGMLGKKKPRCGLSGDVYFGVGCPAERGSKYF
jgi:hypothetical protein